MAGQYQAENTER